MGGLIPNRGLTISWLIRIVVALAGLFLFVTFGATTGPFLPPIFVGWFSYITRMFPPLQVRWGTASFAGICLILLVAGSHLFLRWLSGRVRDRQWRIGWTLSITSLTFLLLLSGMSMMGVAHQTAWLITSPYRLIERRADWNCRHNMRQIGEAIAIYQSDHAGSYPPDLSTLLMTEPLDAGCFICPSSDDQAATTATTREAAESLRQPHHCSYIYLGRGLRNPVPASRVILVEPPQNHAGDGMNVLYGDGHPEWVNRREALTIFEQYGLSDSATQPMEEGQRK